MSTPLDGALVARGAPGVAMYDLHPGDNSQKCTGVEVVETKGPCSFIVEARYATAQIARFAPRANPLEEPPQIDMDFAISQEPRDYDIVGKPLVNSAGEPYDPPLMREQCDSVAVITRNEASRPNWGLNDTLNSDAVLEAQPEELRMRLKARRVIQGEFTYWAVTYTIIRRAHWTDHEGKLVKGWKRRELNRGFKSWQALSTMPGSLLAGIMGFYHILSPIDGQPITTPKLLAADGSELPDGQPATWLYFDEYKAVPWAPLGLPNG
jgi:hypothetical protein